jgi:hypothetical protein
MNPLHGNAYYFWSGVGNDLPIYVLGILPMFITWYRKNECHKPRCHRLGRHPYKHFTYCAKHFDKANNKEIAL